jgi:uncharacterized membrane protein YfcA
MSGEIIAVVLGLLVGGSLGALGGGGSTLAVPILVFVAGMQAQDATTASLLVVGIASAFGVVGHFRNGNVRLGAGVAFGLAGVFGSRVGTLINRQVDERVLLGAFAVLILFVAVRMYRSVGGESAKSAEVEPVAEAAAGGATLVVVVQPTAKRTRPNLSIAALSKLAVAATVVGLLTGLFGVGGGFAVVPALTLLLGFPAKEAIGTSLVFIVINATMALAMRSGDLGFDWAVVLPFLVTVTIGVIVGAQVTADVDADRLTRSFALMLGVVAVYTAISTVLGV